MASKTQISLGRDCNITQHLNVCMMLPIVQFQKVSSGLASPWASLLGSDRITVHGTSNIKDPLNNKKTKTSRDGIVLKN